MLDCPQFYDALQERGVGFFTGVPDSLLKAFCAYVTDNTSSTRHVITANEGSAIGLAAGYYLATGQVPLVYMQNSGLGNAVNPLTSLADREVYGIPMLVLIGWRGEPGQKDEPQHVKMGRINQPLIEAMGIRQAVLPSDLGEACTLLDEALETAKRESEPFALLVPKGTFDAYSLQNTTPQPYAMSREQAIARFVEHLGSKDLVISTTGKPSRELFEVREQRGESHERDFLTVGSMGHSSQIALGVAMERRDRAVYCLDGDGAALMHMGGMATIGSMAPSNYKHVLLNNGAHDSVGGQPTAGFSVDFCRIAAACGYHAVFRAENEAELDGALQALAQAEGPALLEVRVSIGARDDLGRPTMTPQELKHRFRASCEEH